MLQAYVYEKRSTGSECKSECADTVVILNKTKTGYRRQRWESESLATRMQKDLTKKRKY